MITVYRTAPLEREARFRATPDAVARMPRLQRISRTCMHCRVVYTITGAAMRCEWHHERPPS